jgi:hypothetical protein
MRAVTLDTGRPEAPPATPPATADAATWLWVGLIAAGVATVLVGGGRAWWLARPPAERAFLFVAARLGLWGRARRVVRQLAQNVPTPPVALLLSREAFGNAVLASAARGPVDALEVDRVRRRVWG